jgi:hypothetical protein
MNESPKEYRLKILDLATNRHLDQIANPAEENLKYMESNVDEVVWKVATQLYQQSGFKANFTRVSFRFKLSFGSPLIQAGPFQSPRKKPGGATGRLFGMKRYFPSGYSLAPVSPQRFSSSPPTIFNRE